MRTISVAVALFVAAADPLGAQTWQWQQSAHAASGEPINTRSQVDLSQRDVHLSYSTTLHDRTVPIASCSVALGDIASAQTVHNAGRTFLVLRVKPGRSAACDSGPQAVAILPVPDDATATRAAGVIDAACCRAAVPSSPPAVIAQHSAAPHPPRATPSPQPSPAFALSDMVANDGAFFFVRVRNHTSRPVTIDDGTIANCRSVVYGCGSLSARGMTLQPDGVATIATVMSDVAAGGAAFTYRYTARQGNAMFVGGGPSTKRASGWFPAMSAADIREAQAAAIVALRGAASTPGPNQSPAPGQSPAAPPPPAFIPVRLMQRGNSRLAIGKTGAAMVRVSVNADGTPVDATIISVSNKQLAPAAIETAISSTFAPAMRNGKRVAGTYIASFQFDGSDPAQASIPVWRRVPSPSPAAT